LATAQQRAVAGGDAELEALGDAPGAFDEMRRGDRWAGLSGGGLEQGEPAVEMLCVDRQGQVPPHRIAVIVARHQRHGRPERAHASEMRVPIANARLEHRTKQRIVAHPGIEGVDEAADHRLVDAGPGGDVCTGAGASRGGFRRFVDHVR
jgi:hypothetical protein